jgi:ComF family protein
MSALTFAAELLGVLFPPTAPARRARAIDALSETITPRPAHYDAILASCSATALFAYGDPVIRNAIQSLKYDGRKDTVAWFMRHARTHLEDEFREYSLIENERMLVVPVPLSNNRFLERGFNQSALIAKALVELFPNTLDYCDTCLIRNDFTQSQTQARTRKERAKNIAGVFEARNDTHIIGRHVLIVDDVITTGATIHEAARILRAAGAYRVSSFALAH